jgi:hypothetical protein
MAAPRAWEVIDAHVHVIERLAGYGRRGEMRAIGQGRGRWATGEETRILPEGFGDRDFTHDRLVSVLDGEGVAAAILMQGSYYGFCNDYTHEAQQRHPGRLFGMGSFDPHCLEADRILDHLVRDFQFKGLKFEMSASYGFMGYHPDFRLDGEAMRPAWRRAQQDGLVISLDLGTFGEPSLQLEALETIARAHPSVPFVVEHIFFPGRDRFEAVARALDLLAPRENIHFTVASIPASVMPEPYPYPSACRYLEIARNGVGAGRLLWGSDLPSVCLSAGYGQLIDFVADSGHFASAELAAIYAGNARRVYRLD